jgi:hypothetical protein
MFEVPLKFMVAWFLIISVTYAVTGLLYLDTYETNLPEIEQPPQSIIDAIIDGIGWIFDLIISFFKVAFFVLPNMPSEITLALNIIIQPFNIIFLVGIYPIISDIIQKIIDWIVGLIPL